MGRGCYTASTSILACLVVSIISLHSTAPIYKFPLSCIYNHITLYSVYIQFPAQLILHATLRYTMSTSNVPLSCFYMPYYPYLEREFVNISTPLFHKHQRGFHNLISGGGRFDLLKVKFPLLFWLTYLHLISAVIGLHDGNQRANLMQPAGCLFPGGRQTRQT